MDVFVLCFSLVNPISFQNISSKWIPQIRAGNRTSPIILVGTQSDLCQNVDILIHLAQRGAKPVAHSRARRLSRRIGAGDYLECSALTQHNLKDVFDSAVFAAIKQKNIGKKCKKLSMMKRVKAFWGKTLHLIWCWISGPPVWRSCMYCEKKQQFIQLIILLLFAGDVLNNHLTVVYLSCVFFIFLCFICVCMCSVWLKNAPLCNTKLSQFSFHPCFLFSMLGNQLHIEWNSVSGKLEGKQWDKWSPTVTLKVQFTKQKPVKSSHSFIAWTKLLQWLP